MRMMSLRIRGPSVDSPTLDSAGRETTGSGPEVQNTTVIGRVAAVATIVVALLAVAFIVFGSGSSYQIKAIFQNASQLVDGDTVDVAGNPIG
jgi:hypothetical protein